MKAIILTESLHETLRSGIAFAYVSRGMMPYWEPASVNIISGPNAGKIAVPMDDPLLGQPMIPGPSHQTDRSDTIKLRELPDFALMMDLIGNPAIVEIPEDQLQVAPVEELFPLPAVAQEG